VLLASHSKQTTRRKSRSARKLGASHNRRVGCEHGDPATPPGCVRIQVTHDSQKWDTCAKATYQRWVRASSANAAGPSACIRLLRSHTALEDLVACPYVLVKSATSCLVLMSGRSAAV